MANIEQDTGTTGARNDFEKAAFLLLPKDPVIYKRLHATNALQTIPLPPLPPTQVKKEENRVLVWREYTSATMAPQKVELTEWREKQSFAKGKRSRGT